MENTNNDQEVVLTLHTWADVEVVPADTKDKK
jgi:hypothetical protein